MTRPLVYVALQQFCSDDQQPRQLLLDAGFEMRFNTLQRRLRREEMPLLLCEADAVLAGLEPYDAELLKALPRLRCISRCGSGTDTIDLAAAQRLGITIYTTADEVVEPVAQLTVAMMLALARHFPLHLRYCERGLWKREVGHLLSEWTIGLVGFGRIGRTVERYLHVFGPRILVSDPQLSQCDVPPGVELRSLPALLAEADLVSLHAARRKEEDVLLGSRELAMMRRGSFLVNTARGSAACAQLAWVWNRTSRNPK